MTNQRRTQRPGLGRGEDSAVLRVCGVSKSFRMTGPSGVRGLGRKHRSVRAVNDVSFDLRSRQIVGLIGASGSGKSVLTRCIMGIEQPDQGEVGFLDAPSSRSGNPLEDPALAQLMFQDPYASLNPRLSVRAALTEPLRANGMRGRAQRNERASELVALVRLPRSVLGAYPGELSGGQRQRVALARALAPQPGILLADEPTSALDVSVQADILNLLLDLRDELDIAIMIITHNMAVVRQICDVVLVMRLGEIVERGRVDEVLDNPQHRYTQALLEAVPRGLPASQTPVGRTASATGVQRGADASQARSATTAQGKEPRP